MVVTKSTMLPLKTKAPAFNLLNVLSGQYQTLDSLQSKKGVVIAFICNHCPFVIHIRDEFIRIAIEYKKKGIHFVAISSNDVRQHPEDGPDPMKKIAQEFHLPFPYLFDETQEVAKAYKAACTPDFFVFNGEMRCVYRGRMDGSTPGNKIPVTGSDLRAALNNLIAGKPITEDQKPSMGCNIKWKQSI